MNATMTEPTSPAGQLQRLATQREGLRDAAEEAQVKLYAAMLDAYDQGLTYQEIAGAVGLSRIRVCQVLKEERARRKAS